MTDGRFWELIDRTAVHQNDEDLQVSALDEALSSLSLGEIEAFLSQFNCALERSYRWDLWGAGYVITGGMSDDAFEYFRYWLISRGRTTYELALANPDGLADAIDWDEVHGVDFEAFPYVIYDIWERKGGGEVPLASCAERPAEPTGEPIEEDATFLSAHYPKLWQRFGNSPLP